MTIQEMIAGLTIIERAETKAGESGYCISANHDEVFAGGATGKALMSPEELAELERLHWHWDDTYESWSAFT